ncbi:MAG: stage II sporulation protein M [Candidatus Woesearchaeota archaeon]
MVFESIMSPESAEKRPWITFFLAFGLTTIAIFLAHYIFPQHSSLSIVFLTTLFFVPLFYKTMIYEEEKDLDDKADERSLLKQHSRALYFFLFLFMGMTVCFMFWHIVISTTGIMGMESHVVFEVQSTTIQQINAKVTEDSLQRSTTELGIIIFENNLKVMIFCILFSFIYGAGAIFILTWNASVIGLALSNYAMSVLAANTGSGYIFASGCSLVRYMIHGIPEIAAYFIAALAGGIMSVALIKYHFGSEKFEKIVVDAATLIIIAIGILFISMLIEVYISLQYLSTVCIS